MGFSGIGVGAQLKRWYNNSDIVFFERGSALGGTWWINSYPGCACDVPAPLYSYSFEQNVEWSSLFPPALEIQAYLVRVAQKYDIPSKIRFRTNVKSARWDEREQHWVLSIQDLDASRCYQHTCKVLFACTGQLLRPNEVDVPGKEDFQGPMFHTARWRKDVDFASKRILVIGNGCTAAQLVPRLLKDYPSSSVTQLVRSKHWINEAPTIEYTPTFKAALRYIPGALGLLRFMIFLLAEMAFPFFYLNPLANWYRDRSTRRAKAYMLSKTPPELYEAIVPDFELGCKRRIFDPGYLDSLRDPRLHIESRRAVKIVHDGIVLADGTKLEADVILLANGYRSNYFLDDLSVTGVRGNTLQEHWSHFGGPEAYNCSLVSGFPNFAIILGPNAATGHTSAIMAAEK